MERYLIQCSFLGGSTLRGSTVVMDYPQSVICLQHNCLLLFLQCNPLFEEDIDPDVYGIGSGSVGDESTDEEVEMVVIPFISPPSVSMMCRHYK